MVLNFFFWKGGIRLIRGGGGYSYIDKLSESEALMLFYICAECILI